MTEETCLEFSKAFDIMSQEILTEKLTIEFNIFNNDQQEGANSTLERCTDNCEAFLMSIRTSK